MMLFIQIFITVFITLGAWYTLTTVVSYSNNTDATDLTSILIEHTTRTRTRIIKAIYLFANFSFRLLILCVVWQWIIF